MVGGGAVSRAGVRVGRFPRLGFCARYRPGMSWDLGNDFWPAVGAATALATLVSTIVALWWRRIDMRRPEWVTYDGRASWLASDRYGDPTQPGAECTLGNAGSGTAFRVQILGVGCNVRAHGDVRYSQVSGSSYSKTFTVVPAMATGESVELSIACASADWGNAEIAITWREPSPWRLRRRRRLLQIRLRDIGPRPDYVKQETDDGGRVIEVPQPEPTGQALPDSLRPQWPLARGGLLPRLRQRRSLLRGA